MKKLKACKFIMFPGTVLLENCYQKFWAPYKKCTRVLSCSHHIYRL